MLHALSESVLWCPSKTSQQIIIYLLLKDLTLSVFAMNDAYIRSNHIACNFSKLQHTSGLISWDVNHRNICLGLEYGYNTRADIINMGPGSGLLATAVDNDILFVVCLLQEDSYKKLLVKRHESKWRKANWGRYIFT